MDGSRWTRLARSVEVDGGRSGVDVTIDLDDAACAQLASPAADCNHLRFERLTVQSQTLIEVIDKERSVVGLGLRVDGYNLETLGVQRGASKWLDKAAITLAFYENDQITLTADGKTVAMSPDGARHPVTVEIEPSALTDYWHDEGRAEPDAYALGGVWSVSDLTMTADQAMAFSISDMQLTTTTAQRRLASSDVLEVELGYQAGLTVSKAPAERPVAGLGYSSISAYGVTFDGENLMPRLDDELPLAEPFVFMALGVLATLLFERLDSKRQKRADAVSIARSESAVQELVGFGTTGHDFIVSVQGQPIARLTALKPPTSDPESPRDGTEEATPGSAWLGGLNRCLNAARGFLRGLRGA